MTLFFAVWNSILIFWGVMLLQRGSELRSVTGFDLSRLKHCFLSLEEQKLPILLDYLEEAKLSTLGWERGEADWVVVHRRGDDVNVCESRC